jgi:hypothetical protein
VRPVVRVVRAQRGIGNQRGRRRLAAIAQLVPSVQNAPDLADVPHGVLQGGGVLPEERVEIGEHPAEAVLADDEPCRARPLGASHAGNAGRCRDRGDRREEFPSAELICAALLTVHK